MSWESLLKLLLAGALGALIGLERNSHQKEAGLRTHFVVAVGSALIMIVSKYGFADMVGTSFDPSRIAAQVVSGIGFLGAGTILVQRHSVRGLTTAAGLWATAGIGLAVGAGLYIPAFGAALFLVVGLEVLGRMVRPRVVARTRQMRVRMRDVPGILRDVGDVVREFGLDISSTPFQTITGEGEEGMWIEISMPLPRRVKSTALVESLRGIPDVIRIDIQ